jgi:hypothetical protein
VIGSDRQSSESHLEFGEDTGAPDPTWFPEIFPRMDGSKHWHCMNTRRPAAPLERACVGEVQRQARKAKLHPKGTGASSPMLGS